MAKPPTPARLADGRGVEVPFSEGPETSPDVGSPAPAYAELGDFLVEMSEWMLRPRKHDVKRVLKPIGGRHSV